MWVDENNVAHFTVDEIQDEFGKAAGAVRNVWEKYMNRGDGKPLVTIDQLISLVGFLAAHYDGFEDQVEKWAKDFTKK